jgi:hypothetical protein
LCEEVYDLKERRQHTFVNVFEQILKQVGRACRFEIQMAAEFAKERQAVRNNAFIPRTSSAIMDSALRVHCCAVLYRLRVPEPANALSVLFALTVPGRWLVWRRMAMHHESSHQLRVLFVIRHFSRDDGVDIIRVNTILRESTENVRVG